MQVYFLELLPSSPFLRRIKKEARSNHQRSQIYKRASTSVIGGTSDQVSSIWIPVEDMCLNGLEKNLRHPDLIYLKKELVHKEYHDNIGDLDGPEEKERAQAKIQKFIAAF